MKPLKVNKLITFSNSSSKRTLWRDFPINVGRWL